MDTPAEFKIYDADSHYYVPDDCFTRHIEAAYADRAVRVVRGEEKSARTYIGQERSTFFQRAAGRDHWTARILRGFSEVRQRRR